MRNLIQTHDERACYYNEFTAVCLLVDVGKASKGVEELHDTLFLLERGILLERLLDHLPKLLGLWRTGAVLGGS